MRVVTSAMPLLPALMAGAVLLSPGGAWAQATSNVNPKTYQQWVRYCSSTPWAGHCRQATLYFRQLRNTEKMGVARRYWATWRLNYHLRKARQDYLRLQYGNHERNQKFWMRRLLLAAKERLAAVHRAWIRLRQRSWAANRSSPFENNGGFGENVQRSGREIRDSWVYRRGRFAHLNQHRQVRTRKPGVAIPGAKPSRPHHGTPRALPNQ